MSSKITNETTHIVSTDIGIMHVSLQSVVDYDIEDIVHDKAVSQARAVQALYAGKQVDPTAPTASRTIKSVWLNNDQEL